MSYELVPNNEQVEISLFGPGYGECVVLHLGNNEWLIVDSCLNSNRDVCAIEYLNDIGVTLENVKYIVATHWHDDHIRGLASIYKQSRSAELFISNALRSPEFLKLVDLRAGKGGTATSGLDTFGEIFKEGDNRCSSGARGINLAVANTSLTPHSSPYRITALSPSSGLCINAVASLGKLVYDVEKERDKPRILSPKPNETAIVLWIEMGTRRVLLGADLEEKELNGEWTRLLSLASGLSDAEVFKVPHHGSINGHHSGVWNTLVKKTNPIAIVTPYSRGQNPLPAMTDISRIKSLASISAITSKQYLSKNKLPRRGMLNKTILKATKMFRPIEMATGQIRLRASSTLTTPWNVEFFGTACYL